MHLDKATRLIQDLTTDKDRLSNLLPNVIWIGPQTLVGVNPQIKLSEIEFKDKKKRFKYFHLFTYLTHIY